MIAFADKPPAESKFKRAASKVLSKRQSIKSKITNYLLNCNLVW